MSLNIRLPESRILAFLFLRNPKTQAFDFYFDKMKIPKKQFESIKLKMLSSNIYEIATQSSLFHLFHEIHLFDSVKMITQTIKHCLVTHYTSFHYYAFSNN